MTVWRRLGRGYTLFAVMFVNTLLCVVILNGVLGLIYPFIDQARINNEGNAPGSLQYQRDLLAKAYPDWDVTARDTMLHETWTRPLRCAPFVYFREAPYSGTYVNVDDAGFRYNAPPDTPPSLWQLDDTAINIFVFGGSTTFGYGVADHETIPAHLEAVLAESLPEVRVHVYNFGQAYYFSTQEMLLLYWLVQKGITPDIALFIDGLNEGLGNVEAFPTFNCTRLDLSEERRPRIPLERLLDSIRYRIFGQPTGEVITTPTAPPTTAWDEQEIAQQFSDSTLMLWRLNRELIKTLAATKGFTSLFVWQPAPDYQYDLSYHLFFTEADINPRRIQLYDDIFAASERELWTDFLWLGSIQADIRESLYVDRIHYNSTFHRMIAQEIARFILDRNLINTP